MKFSYRFSNLLGSVYRKGNLLFTPDGNSVISPVGNRVSIFDLKNNKSETLPVESGMNFTAITMSPDGNLLIAVNEEGEALLISLISKSVLHFYRFHSPVYTISFSPNGRKFAVTKGNTVQVFHAPGRTKEFNPFVLYRTYYGAYDETVSIDWTTDSRVFCFGSKDMNTRVCAAERFNNLVIYSMAGNRDAIINSFFENDSLNLYSLSANGQLCIWECDTGLAGLLPVEKVEKPEPEQEPEKDAASDEEGEDRGQEKAQNVQEVEHQKKKHNIVYKMKFRHQVKKPGQGTHGSKVTSAAYHKRTHILCTGYSDGSFFLHELPDVNLIHSLSISDQIIASVAFNKPGDWIALGCGGMGQLLVWEWQSESYVLKQQGHFNNMSCLVYSPDGQYIATGGDDAKVKVWNTSSGFCFVTFSEHLAGITGIAFNQNGQVVVSASLDGTVRAFDLNRYRNFRTFTSPRPAQFFSLALDGSGEVVCAGAQDSFEIFVWSMKTGRLLEILAGHSAPVCTLAFSSSHSILASGSWDKTVKLWDVFKSRGAKETISLNSDVLAVTYRPDGNQLAVATLDGQLTFWNAHSAMQEYSIEGRADLGYSRKETDKITAKKSAAAKSFNTLCYTADGKCVLAAGRSKNICIYSVVDQILIKKFEVTCNRSLDGIQEFLDRRKMTEWGNMALVDEGQGGQALSLPGVKKGDMSSRHWKPEVRVSGVQFSPTGRAWAATTTEGLLIYSLDHNLVFDPFELEVDITPISVRERLVAAEYSTALMMAFRLNEQGLIQEVLETIPVHDVEVISHLLPDIYVDKLLNFVAAQIESSHHIEFYLRWCQQLLFIHGPRLKLRSGANMALLRTLQKNLTRRYEDLSKLCDHNKYGLQFLLSLSQNKRKREEHGRKDGKESDMDDQSDLGDSESEKAMSESDTSLQACAE